MRIPGEVAWNFLSLSLNKYLYGEGNAANATDPTGHMSLSTVAVAIAISSISTVGLNATTSYFALKGMTNARGVPDAVMLSLRGTVAAIGGSLSGGVDVVYDLRSHEIFAAMTGEFGLAPASIFAKQRGFGLGVSAGLVYDMDSVEDLSGRGIVANWPLKALHLLPGSVFSVSRAWGAMSQLAKLTKNGRGLTLALGISPSGPSFWQIGKDISFAATASHTTEFEHISIAELPAQAADALRLAAEYANMPNEPRAQSLIDGIQ